MSILRSHPGSLLAIVAAGLVLAGCQQWHLARPAEPPWEERASEVPQRTVESIDQAMTLLQQGEVEAAETILADIEERQPDNATARLLLAQIRQPPEMLLGERFEEIVVQPGDSLSAIARRTAGNELLFYSLARLNDIEIPRLLRPGQRLRAPSAERPEAAAGDAAEHPSPGLAAADGHELTAAARDLIDRERFSQAYALLLSAARAGRLELPAEELLAEAAVALARAASRDGALDRADRYLGQAAPWLGASALDHSGFARQQRHVAAQRTLDAAQSFLARDNDDAAFEAVMNARQLGPELPETQLQQLKKLEHALGARYHDRALSAWRDQQVDLAVRLWERVVELEPDFEPARRYLERARLVRQELKNLDATSMRTRSAAAFRTRILAV